MNKITFLSVVVLLLFSLDPSYAQSRISPDEFAHILIENPGELTSLLKKSELNKSLRLGINYDIDYPKFLISYLPSPQQLKAIKEGNISYQAESLSISTDIDLFRIKLSDSNIPAYTFYFYQDSLISPVTALTTSWSIYKSKYFEFLVEDESMINEYCIQKLDEFAEKTAETLKIPAEKLSNLQRNKILYVLAKDETSVNKLTGYTSQGQYNLAYDAVITTYNAHYHEVAHLMISYKLSELSLFTHPTIQEGLAVALGGRGGLAKEPLFVFADFVLNNNFIDSKNLLSPSGFSGIQPSISYAAAGLYTYSRLKDIGIDAILNEYQNYSSTDRNNIPDLQPDYLRYSTNTINESDLISIAYERTNSLEWKKIYDKGKNQIYRSDEFYFFSITDTLLLASTSPPISLTYSSRKFNEVFQDRLYFGKQYLVVVNEAEIALYDLYTNTLLTNYVLGFRSSPVPIKATDNSYTFLISRQAFPKDIFESN